MKKFKPAVAMVIFMLAAGAIATAFEVSNNPSGAFSAFYLKYFAKAKPVSFTLKSYNGTTLDTTDAGNREYVWLCPFDCRLDSVKIVLGSGYGADSLLDADSAVASCFTFRVISNNSATNGDTIRIDSTVSASLGTTKSAMTVWKPRGGPDSTKNKVAKGKIVRFLYKTVGTTESKITMGVNFLAIPADQ